MANPGELEMVLQHLGAPTGVGDDKSQPEGDQEGDGTTLNAAAGEMMTAMKSNDAQGFATALRAFVDMCLTGDMDGQ